MTQAPAIPDTDTLDEEGRQLAIEYIKAMLEYARDDARQVYLRVTAAVAVAVLMVTQLPFKQLHDLANAPKIAFFGVLATLTLAALLHHVFLQKIHHCRVAIAQCLPTADATKAQQLGPPSWNRYLPAFYLGDVLLVVSAGLLGWVLVELMG